MLDYFSQKDEIFAAHKDAVNSESGSPNWLGVLVGTDIDPSLQQQIVSGDLKISNDIGIAALVVSRYRSDDGQVFVTVDSFFKSAAIRDRTKYIFNDETYGKGRLALAIVKQYIEDHPSIKYADLEQVFPKRTQGTLGVFSTLDDAQKLYQKWGYKRHFLDEEDALKVGAITIAICSQWGKSNIGNIISIAKKLNYKVKEA